MAAIERCASCGGIITANDESFLWGELVVCRACYGTLATNEREPALTRPMQFGPLTIGPDVLTYGSVTVPISNIASIQIFNTRESTEEPGSVMLYAILGIGGPLTILGIAGASSDLWKRAPESVAFAIGTIVVLSAAVCFIYYGLKILSELTGRRSAIFLTVTTTAGQQVRINFTNSVVMQRALSAIRQAVGARGGSTNINVAVLNSPTVVRR